MKHPIVLALGTALLLPGLASAENLAQGTKYVGVQFTQITIESDIPPQLGAGSTEEWKPGALMLRSGYFFQDQLALEVRAGRGFDSDEAVGVEVDLEYLAGLYLLGHLPVGEQFSVYALAGYSWGEITEKRGFRNETTSRDDGFSWGLGAEAYITERLGVQLEYVRYLDKSSYDVSAPSLGVKYRF